MIFAGTIELALPGVRVLRFQRHPDARGYFVETFRRTQFSTAPVDTLLGDLELAQLNESFSYAGTIRGLHFQWNPPMGKLVRTVHGHMVDLIMDIRQDSSLLGKVIAYDMPEDREFLEWIWVPPGFAHGNYFLADTRIEYICTAEHNPACEAGISPLAADVDWSLCESGLKSTFDEIAARTNLITDKDRHGMSLAAWLHDSRSSNFTRFDFRV
jgi:dTDP-4-dehydrorhamnose 3,5-epimerase